MEAKSGQMVTFYLGKELFGINLSWVREIIRVPEMIGVPGTPPYFSGLANLRGSILPVVDTRRRFGLPAEGYTDSARVIVTERGGEAVGLVVDRMSEVIGLEEAAEEPLSLAGVREEFVSRVVRPPGGKMVMEINLDTVLPALEKKRDTDSRLLTAAAGGAGEAVSARAGTAAGDIGQYVGFRLGGEEYAVNIECVQEIVRVPDKISRSPGFPPHMDGLFSLRSRTVPLVNLRRYLSFPDRPYDERSRVVVVALKEGEKVSVFGLGVDAVTEVLRFSEKDIGALPGLLAGESNGCLKGICRLGEDRLIYILEPRTMSAVCRVGESEQAGTDRGEMYDLRDDEEQYVIFNLAKEDYALGIDRVQEILRLPQIAAVPGAPAYVEGLVNVRGSILPVIDLRKKLEVTVAERDERARIIVVELSGTPTGLIVDAVREVRKIARGQVEDVPAVLKPLKGASFLSGVVKQGEGERSILLLNLENVVNAEEAEEVSRLAEEAAAQGCLPQDLPDGAPGPEEG